MTTRWPSATHFINRHCELEGSCHDDTLSLCHSILALTDSSCGYFQSTFCSTWMKHFFCGVWPMLDLVCATPITNDILTSMISLLAIRVPATYLFISYVLIISTILKIASIESWKKTFGTCTSHLTMAASHCLLQAQVREHQRSRSVHLRDLLCHNTFTESCGV